jgi:ABC-type Mn2+/Zn2+ transport system permease subunit
VSPLAVFDPIFRVPFVTGLVFAAILPVLGMYLRLREEWLAALAFAQLAAAGSLAAAIVSLPLWAGAIVASAFAAIVKAWTSRSGNNGYALFMLLGWGCGILMLANIPMAEHLGHALYDGQLYFTGPSHLEVAIGFLAACGAVVPWLSPKLLLERMFPDFFLASGLSPRRYHLCFDLLVAGGVALATASIGVMAAFGLVFVPPMIAYQIGINWKAALTIAITASCLAYIASFELALVLDQPFGPTLVVVLVCMAAIAYLVRRFMILTADDIK